MSPVLAAPPPAAAHAEPRIVLRGAVSEVVDGDTVKVVVGRAETTVRLVGIDTPETRKPGTPVQCFGPQASARAAALMPVGGAVTVVTGPAQARYDRYRRLLAYVYRPGRRGPAGSVNFSLVASGHAKVYVYGGVRFRHAVAFFRAQHRARKARRGLWGPPCDGDTDQPARAASAAALPAQS